MAEQTYTIEGLPPVANPATELAGALLEVETLTGPGGSRENKHVTAEQLRTLFGGTPNSAPSLLKSFRFLRAADRDASIAANNGGGGALETDLIWASCCQGTRIFVEFSTEDNGATLHNQWFEVVYNAAPSPDPTHQIYFDASFTPGQLAPGKYVPIAAGGGGLTPEQQEQLDIWQYVGDPANENISRGVLDSSNTFGNYFTSNTFGNYLYSNTFGNDLNSNTFGSSLDSNTFGSSLGSNTFGSNLYSNTFGNYLYNNTFGNDLTSNTFGNYFTSNTFGNYLYNNTFGNDLTSNTFGDYLGSNTFGNGLYSNTFGNNCQYLQVGDNCTRVEIYNCHGTSSALFIIPDGTTDAVYRNGQLESTLSADGLTRTYHVAHLKAQQGTEPDDVALLSDVAAASGTALSDATPLPDGTATPGTAIDASRSDHVHPENPQIAANTQAITDEANLRVWADNQEANARQAADALKEDKANKATNLSAPNATQYPNTQAAADGDAAVLLAAKAYTDNAVIGGAHIAGPYDASANPGYPTSGTGPSGGVRLGDTYNISAAGTVGGIAVEYGDGLQAIAANPGQVAAKWQILQANIYQATETVAGDGKLATQAVIQNEGTTNDTDFVTAKKFWQGIARLLAKANTWALKQTFTVSPQVPNGSDPTDAMAYGQRLQLGTATPLADTPTGSVGTASTASKSDHQHPDSPAIAAGDAATLTAANAYTDGKATGFHGVVVSGVVAIGSGTKSTTITSSLVYQVGDRVRIASAAGWVEGPITSYTASSGALGFTVDAFFGSGSLGAGAKAGPGEVLAPVGTAGTTAYPASITTNAQGQVTSATAGTTVVRSAVSAAKKSAVRTAVLASTYGWVLDSATTVSGDTLTSADYVDRYFTDTVNTPAAPQKYECVLDVNSSGTTQIIWITTKISK